MCNVPTSRYPSCVLSPCSGPIAASCKGTGLLSQLASGPPSQDLLAAPPMDGKQTIRIVCPLGPSNSVARHAANSRRHSRCHDPIFSVISCRVAGKRTICERPCIRQQDAPLPFKQRSWCLRSTLAAASTCEASRRVPAQVFCAQDLSAVSLCFTCVFHGGLVANIPCVLLLQLRCRSTWRRQRLPRLHCSPSIGKRFPRRRPQPSPASGPA